MRGRLPWMPPGGRHQHSRSSQASPHRTEVRMEQGSEGAGALPSARQQRMLVLAALKVNAGQRRLKRLLRMPDDVDNFGRHVHAVNVKHDVREERAVTQDPPGAAKGGGKLPGFDTSTANAARMWNYWIGGTDNFLADREAGDRVLEAMPALPVVAPTLRRFLDTGSGLPTADNTHDVAQGAAPESRIVYVDHDPVVISQARSLLTSSA